MESSAHSATESAAQNEIVSLRRLLSVGRQLLSELDPEVVLQRIVEEARQVTGARYAALGVLGEDRQELDRFITDGMDPRTRRLIGDLPRGRGVLGTLIEHPRALRLADVSGHPDSFGFPAGHPPMRSFLGMPIIIRGHAWGNLYLTEKTGGTDFTELDEEAVAILADFAATAIENARLYDTAERGRQELARAVQGLEAARTIADAVSIEPELGRVLELVVKRGRALVGARSVVILLRVHEDLELVAGAGVAASAIGFRAKIDASTAGGVLRQGVPVWVSDAQHNLKISPDELGVTDAQTALIVPMSHRGVGDGCR